MNVLFSIVGLSTTFGLLHASEIERIGAPLPNEMQRAEIYVSRAVKRPQAILVLIPGTNGNGEGLIRKPAWQEFALKNNLGLVGVSFASEMSILAGGRGYYYPKLGSGDALIECLRKAYGKKLPLLLYGFSAGAYFTSRFVEWKPDMVLTWCAYSAGNWEEPNHHQVNHPPGIVGCGELDPWLGASLIYFKQGRAIGRPWLWISLAKTGHATNAQFEGFVRNYFEAILATRGKLDAEKSGVWIDIDRMQAVNVTSQPPSVTAWLPEQKLLDAWRSIHTP